MAGSGRMRAAFPRPWGQLWQRVLSVAASHQLTVSATLRSLDICDQLRLTAGFRVVQASCCAPGITNGTSAPRGANGSQPSATFAAPKPRPRADRCVHPREDLWNFATSKMSVRAFRFDDKYQKRSVRKRRLQASGELGLTLPLDIRPQSGRQRCDSYASNVREYNSECAVWRSRAMRPVDRSALGSPWLRMGSGNVGRRLPRQFVEYEAGGKQERAGEPTDDVDPRKLAESEYLPHPRLENDPFGHGR